MALVKFGFIAWLVVGGLGVLVAYPPMFLMLLLAWGGITFISVCLKAGNSS